MEQQSQTGLESGAINKENRANGKAASGCATMIHGRSGDTEDASEAGNGKRKRVTGYRRSESVFSWEPT